MDLDRPSVEEIPVEERKLIEEHNQLDIELYRHASALFEQRLAQAGEDLRSEVEALRVASKAANEKDHAEVQAVAVWLERELPPGRVTLPDAVRETANSRGIPENQLRRALRLVKDRRTAIQSAT